jgi:hypothetical protein
MTVGDIEFVVTEAGVVVAESLVLFDPDEYDEERIAFTIAPEIAP